MRQRHIYSLLLAAILLVASCGHRGGDAPVRHAREEFCAEAVSTAANDTVLSADTVAQTNREFQRVDLALRVKRGKAFVLHTEGLLLEAGDTALLHDATLSVTVLRGEEVAALPSDHVNVTGGSGEAYRLLPSGRHFKPYAELRVAYNEERLPFGYTPEDIYTSYYSEAQRQWVRLERVEVDTLNREIVSLTDHFTDFVNEVLKAPEMPETQAFVPTMMSELEAASPLAGLTLIEPPAANNSGTANLSYPIELPAGRRGMQPSLALSYSSGGGQGWLGVGWDIAIPSISVETRWGVPRYDRRKESEVYLLNGEQLLAKDAGGEFLPMPHRTNQWQGRMAGDVQYWPRVDESHDSIVRHGNAPDNYWWEVFDRNGVAHIYGKDSAGRVATLRTGRGDIARWMLTESRDPYGNSVRYYYDVETAPVVEGEENVGRQIYPSRISYTCHRGEEGKYEVVFERSGQRRIDPQTRCSAGFAEVTAATLCNVTVYYGHSPVRAYLFEYENGSRTMHKTRLAGFVRVDSADCWDCIRGHYCAAAGQPYGKPYEGVEYRFEYYDAPEEVFDSLPTRLPHPAGAPRFGRYWDEVGEAVNRTSGLGSTASKGWSIGGALTVALDNSVWAKQSLALGGSVGGTYSHDKTVSSGEVTLVDLNGDGMPDVVEKGDDGVVRYRLMEMDTASGEPAGWEGQFRRLGVDDVLRTTQVANNWGVQVSVTGGPLAGSASLSWGGGSATTTVYLADVNADGLPDLVTPDGILFNRLTPEGRPTFLECAPAGDSNEVNTNINGRECDVILFDGEADYRIGCTLVDATPSAMTLREYDSLRRAGEEVYITNWRRAAAADDTVQVLVDPVWDCPVGGRNGDPTLEAVKVWVAPRAGTVVLRDTARLVADEGMAQARFADGVRLLVQKNTGVRYSSDSTQFLPGSGSELLYTRDIDRNDTALHADSTALEVERGDILFFRMDSRGTQEYDRVDWVHDITYLTDNPREPYDGFGFPSGKFNSREDFVLESESYFSAPCDCAAYLSLEYRQTEHDSPVRVTVYVAGIAVWSQELWADTTRREVLPLDGTQLSQGDSVVVVAQTYLPGELELKPRLTFIPTGDTMFSETDTVRLTVPYRISREGDDYRYAPIARSLFGPLYRGWGQFAYHAGAGDNTISLANLKPNADAGITDGDSAGVRDWLTQGSPLDTNASQGETLSLLEGDKLRVPLTASNRWVGMEPDVENQVWTGYGRTTSIGRLRVSNEREETFYADTLVSPTPLYDSPVPLSREGTPVRYAFKMSSSSQIGVSVGMEPLGSSHSTSRDTLVSDYMDLNGDRYPDIVGRGGVQYSQPWGGVGEMRLWPAGMDGQTLTKVRAEGASFSGTAASSEKIHFNNARRSLYAVRSDASVGASASFSNDHTVATWMDVNGDGLPDKVDGSGRVALNTGYGFLGYEDWSCVRQAGYSVSGSVSGDAALSRRNSRWLGSLKVGKSRSHAASNTTCTYVDLNGDGLADRLTDNLLGRSEVEYNLGGGRWSSPVPLNISTVRRSATSGVNASVGATLGVPILSWLKITGSAEGAPLTGSLSNDRVQLVDINNDGCPDYVEADGGSFEVRYNRCAKANLLKCVRNFTGSTVTIGYSLTPSTCGSPHRQWVMDTVLTEDATTPASTRRTLSTFRYGDPRYDRFERASYGFGEVVTRQHDEQGVYRCTVERYNNSSYVKRGKKLSDCLYDREGHPYIENLYDCQVVDHINRLPVGDDDCPAYVYPKKDVQITNYYEGGDAPRLTTMTQTVYDSLRNVVRFIDYGDTAAGDSLVMRLHYHKGARNLIGLRDSVELREYRGGGSAVLRRMSCQYNPQGSLIFQSAYNGGASHTTRYFIDATYGNVDSVVAPPNHRSQRYGRHYTYDPVVHTYCTEVRDSYRERSTAEYDYRFGVPVKVTDRAGGTVRYEYDCVGRLTAVTSPLRHNGVTVRQRYYPRGYHHGTAVTTPVYSYAVVEQYDDDGADTIVSVLFADARGRAIQTQRESVVEGHRCRVASPLVRCDMLGRAVRQYSPERVPAAYPLHLYWPMSDSSLVTTTAYDPLDRVVSTTLPDGSTSTQDYSLGADRLMLQRQTDALGNTTRTYVDGRGQTVKVTDAAGNTTRFDYDLMGQLLESRDPEGVSTRYHYDGLGRLVRRDHPDAGATRFTYDPAGNLTCTKYATGDSVRNHYRYNRLDSVTYSRLPGNNIHYTYDAAGRVATVSDGSGVQQFKYDALGNITENIRTFAIPGSPCTYTFRMLFEHDSWNRMRSITYPDGEVVRYHYDAGGALDSVTGRKGSERFRYVDSTRYNKYGQRSAIYYGNGTRAEYTYDNLQRLSRLVSVDGQGNVMQNLRYTYDAVSNITRVDNRAPAIGPLGGSYTNTYQYDNLYRLAHSDQSYGAGNALDMDYSPNGRVLSKSQTAKGQDLVYAYCPESQPHAIRRIYNQKDNALLDLQWDANGNLAQVNHYKERRDYAYSRFHYWTEDNRLSAVVDPKHFSYYGYDCSGERTLKLAGDCTLLDINADRMLVSANLDRVTLYTSPYMVATERGYTKHIYAGTERVCAQKGAGGFDNMHPLVKEDPALAGGATRLFEDVRNGMGSTRVAGGCENEGDELLGWELEEPAAHVEVKAIPDPSQFGLTLKILAQAPRQGLIPTITEPDLYFYHPDHLGSASWITDASGVPIQHVQYCPYGEPFVDQHTGCYTERFTFTGKERDEETGYHYFGARYLDADWMTGWLSVDPMSDKYSNITPYHYSGWNPVKLVDPDGNRIVLTSTIYGVPASKGCREAFYSVINQLRQQDAGFDKMYREMESMKCAVAVMITPGAMGGMENYNHDILVSYSFAEVESQYNPSNIALRVRWDPTSLVSKSANPGDDITPADQLKFVMCAAYKYMSTVGKYWDESHKAQQNREFSLAQRYGEIYDERRNQWESTLDCKWARWSQDYFGGQCQPGKFLNIGRDENGRINPYADFDLPQNYKNDLRKQVPTTWTELFN